jgi:sugar lactone lactonase YvrE
MIGKEVTATMKQSAISAPFCLDMDYCFIHSHKGGYFVSNQTMNQTSKRMKTKLIKSYNSLNTAMSLAAVVFTAVNLPAQNLLVSDYNNGDIYQITPGGAQSVFASGMNYPFGMAFNSAGDLFVANSANDSGAGSIVEITPGGAQSTFASGVDPKALAFNNVGDLFESDYKSGNIYEYTPNGTRTTFASGLSTPQALAFNSAGDLFVGAGYGNGNGYIEEITPNGTQTTFASGLSFPSQLAFGSTGDLYVACQTTGAIYQFTPGGAQSTFATVPGNLWGLAFDNTGDLFASSFGGSIYKITPAGAQSTLTTESGIAANLVFEPVPEPSTVVISGLALGAFAYSRRAVKAKGACRLT